GIRPGSRVADRVDRGRRRGEPHAAEHADRRRRERDTRPSRPTVRAHGYPPGLEGPPRVLVATRPNPRRGASQPTTSPFRSPEPPARGATTPSGRAPPRGRRRRVAKECRGEVPRDGSTH